MDRALGLKLSTNRNHSSFDEGENSLLEQYLVIGIQNS